MSKTSKKHHGSTSHKPRKATAADWISGARIRTLPLAFAPVAIGSGAAALTDQFKAPVALLCLVVALALQIGVNYSNDYSDGIRGTDNYRVGPARLTGSGAADPKKVLAVALAFFALSAVAGVIIVILTSAWWMLAIGAVAIVAAWFYTGGRRPYGYAGLGEIMVFIFFGLVATVGTTYVQTGTLSQESLIGGIGIGLISCAVLVVNNIRDIETDKLAGKKTLAVRMGRTPSAVLFCFLMLIPFGIVIYLGLFYAAAFLTLFALLAALPACLITLTAKTPPEYILALKLSSLTGLLYGLGLAFTFFV
ncbi:1,4-dihydroxy-2-naphthoate octaprenyltransferase [Aurantimicrobium minutum]|uniref:1,4-dihydroxy-2-naphthoate polyprenyltransferase n=1 Tax=Aurantimicrobium minutum TaxID=708131 RepID=UPI002475B33E|nr:1,4-dihydroxy-2-naphthoate polyprenyltransferase [Aurantimicrobium minutum]MDH6423975.1 1,4-dihydroxy-2-naphthoate octaprenyltransferase [Aurantimicrobium minutum]